MNFNKVAALAKEWQLARVTKFEKGDDVLIRSIEGWPSLLWERNLSQISGHESKLWVFPQGDDLDPIELTRTYNPGGIDFSVFANMPPDSWVALPDGEPVLYSVEQLGVIPSYFVRINNIPLYRNSERGFMRHIFVFRCDESDWDQVVDECKRDFHWVELWSDLKRLDQKLATTQVFTYKGKQLSFGFYDANDFLGTLAKWIPKQDVMEITEGGFERGKQNFLKMVADADTAKIYGSFRSVEALFIGLGRLAECNLDQTEFYRQATVLIENNQYAKMLGLFLADQPSSASWANELLMKAYCPETA